MAWQFQTAIDEDAYVYPTLNITIDIIRNIPYNIYDIIMSCGASKVKKKSKKRKTKLHIHHCSSLGPSASPTFAAPDVLHIQTNIMLYGYFIIRPWLFCIDNPQSSIHWSGHSINYTLVGTSLWLLKLPWLFFSFSKDYFLSTGLWTPWPHFDLEL